jgi:hypothetical protein
MVPGRGGDRVAAIGATFVRPGMLYRTTALRAPAASAVFHDGAATPMDA